MLDQIKINNINLLEEVKKIDCKEKANSRIIEILTIEYWINSIRQSKILNHDSIETLNNKSWYCEEKYISNSECIVTLFDKNRNSICSFKDNNKNITMKIIFVKLD